MGLISQIICIIWYAIQATEWSHEKLVDHVCELTRLLDARPDELVTSVAKAKDKDKVMIIFSLMTLASHLSYMIMIYDDINCFRLTHH